MKRYYLQFSLVLLFMLVLIPTFISVSCTGDDDDDQATPTVTGTAGKPTSTPTPTSTVGTHAIVGIWSGSWEDTVYHLTGSLDATVTQDGTTLDGTGTIGLEAFGLGKIQGTASGTIEGDTVNFTFTAYVGSGNGTIIGNDISGSGQVTDLFPYDISFTFTGTIEGDTIDGTFTFQGGGAGIATVTRQ